MSKKLRAYEDLNGKVMTVNEFYAGEEHGKAIQITIPVGYELGYAFAKLTKKQVLDLKYILDEWLDNYPPVSEECKMVDINGKEKEFDE